MGINKGERFTEGDIFMDSPYEGVTYSWEHVSKSIFDRPPPAITAPTHLTPLNPMIHRHH